MFKFTTITKEEITRYAQTLGAPASVYLLLKLYGGKAGIAYPSQKSLSDLTGFSERTIRRALKQLQDDHMIDHLGYKQGLIRTAIYRVGQIRPPPQHPPDRSGRGGRTDLAGGVGQIWPPINKKEKKKDNYISNFDSLSALMSQGFTEAEAKEILSKC